MSDPPPQQQGQPFGSAGLEAALTPSSSQHFDDPSYNALPTLPTAHYMSGDTRPSRRVVFSNLPPTFSTSPVRHPDDPNSPPPEPFWLEDIPTTVSRHGSAASQSNMVSGRYPSCPRCDLEFGTSAIPARVLACGHAFCERCLEQMREDRTIQCSQCLSFTTMRGTDVKELPKNYILGEVGQSAPISHDSFIRRVGTCPICMENYNRVHVPRVLKCGHTFCQRCLVQFIRGNEIRCPNRCTETTSVNPNDPDRGAPPLNMSLLATLRKKTRAASLYISGPTPFPFEERPPEPAAPPPRPRPPPRPQQQSSIPDGFWTFLFDFCITMLTFALGGFTIWLFAAFQGDYCEQPLAPWLLAFGIWLFAIRSVYFVYQGLMWAEKVQAANVVLVVFTVLNFCSLALYAVGVAFSFAVPHEYACRAVLVIVTRVVSLIYLVLVSLVFIWLAVTLGIAAMAERSPSRPAATAAPVGQAPHPPAP